MLGGGGVFVAVGAGRKVGVATCPCGNVVDNGVGLDGGALVPVVASLVGVNEMTSVGSA
jgi:hypothetical protein